MLFKLFMLLLYCYQYSSIHKNIPCPVVDSSAEYFIFNNIL